jgi:hypothetical protein
MEEIHFIRKSLILLIKHLELRLLKLQGWFESFDVGSYIDSGRVMAVRGYFEKLYTVFRGARACSVNVEKVCRKLCNF